MHAYDFIWYNDPNSGWMLVAKHTFKILGLTEADVSPKTRHLKDVIALEGVHDAEVFQKAWLAAHPERDEILYRVHTTYRTDEIPTWDAFGIHA